MYQVPHRVQNETTSYVLEYFLFYLCLCQEVRKLSLHGFFTKSHCNYKSSILFPIIPNEKKRQINVCMLETPDRALKEGRCGRWRIRNAVS